MEKHQPGTYFFDLENKVVRKYEGFDDDGNPIFVEVNQETFEDLPVDPADKPDQSKDTTQLPIFSQDPLA